ncbi:MAG TPA: chemotaxis protein CheD [bacterium]|nr:chemotaxis protein CheD [bacterium]
MAEENRVVGIAEIIVSQSPQKLMAYGLGSCVGVTLYDARNKTGGLAHVMLPSSQLHSNETPPPGKYADTALTALVAEMQKAGCRVKGLEAKIVGGANMFASLSQSSMPIGLRNVSAIRHILLGKDIPIVGEDIGGSQGRTMIFNLGDGRIEIRKLNLPVEYL